MHLKRQLLQPVIKGCCHQKTSLDKSFEKKSFPTPWAIRLRQHMHKRFPCFQSCVLRKRLGTAALSLALTELVARAHRGDSWEKAVLQSPCLQRPAWAHKMALLCATSGINTMAQRPARARGVFLQCLDGRKMNGWWRHTVDSNSPWAGYESPPANSANVGDWMAMCLLSKPLVRGEGASWWNDTVSRACRSGHEMCLPGNEWAVCVHELCKY